MSMALPRCMAWIAAALPALSCAAAPFDAPLKVRTLHLSPDPQNPKSRRQVTCFYYRSIVVKQVDYGEVGADRLGLLPVLSRNATLCRPDREPGEYVLPPETWSGHFKGVKADYAFFDAPDGVNGGLGFMALRIYDRKALFEDIAQRGLKSIEIEEGALKLRYQRVFEGNCSVMSSGEACRDAIARDTGVSASSLSICDLGYQAAKQAMARGRCEAQSSHQASCNSDELARLDQQKWDEARSVIVYEVETVLKDGLVAITPRSDALACHPSD
jgi:hypothetical protein